MRSTRSSKAGLINAFQGELPVIDVLCRSSEDFRELFGHYEECLAVLSALSRKDASDQQRLEEYQQLTLELEREIREMLRKSSTN